MILSKELKADLFAALPGLRAYAISLSGNTDRANDLVQETVTRALEHIDSFEPGTNMHAWIFTILRNLTRSEYRKRRREVVDRDGKYAESLKSIPEQHSRIEFEEFSRALQMLPADRREALMLIGIYGLSYEDAARVCGCLIGTVKSRVNRARVQLRALLGYDENEPIWKSAGELGPLLPIDFHRDAPVQRLRNGKLNGARQSLPLAKIEIPKVRSAGSARVEQRMERVAPTDCKTVQIGETMLYHARTIDIGRDRLARIYVIEK